jgi:hypothetical protein
LPWLVYAQGLGASQLVLLSTAGGETILHSAPTLPSDITYTLPASDGSPGQVLTTDGSGQLSWSWNPGTIFIRKTSDQLVNSTTPLPDNHLSATLPANSIWEVEILLRTQAGGTNNSSNGGIQVQLNAPTGTSMQVYVEIKKGGPANSDNLLHNWHYGWIMAPATAVSFSPIPATTQTGAVKLKGLVFVGNTAGTLQLFWAQSATYGNPTTVYANSYMRLTRIQ